MKGLLLGLLTLVPIHLSAQGKVGINTMTPSAMFHVNDSSVLFTGPSTIPSPGNAPINGSGTRLMWFPNKASFRVGYVGSTQWDNANIGNFSMGFGFNTIASGPHATAMGGTTTASGYGSTTFGVSTLASASYATALGRETSAYGQNSLATGYQTEAHGVYSTTMGHATLSKPYACLTLGRYNDTTSISSTSWNSGDPVFIVGNGSGNSTRSNAITILKNGNVGIGTASPGFLLNFPSTAGNKISLYGNSGNHFGFGIQTSLLQIYTDNNLGDIAFGFGNSAAFTEKVRIKGNGNVGIGISTPGFPLNFSTALGDKISLWGNTGAHYGLGIQSNALQIHTDVSASDVVFGYGTSSALTETMRIKGNGNVGIGNNNPAFKLDVFGRMRLRHGADGSPGIWFNKSDNTAPIAFMGMLNNEYIGLYGDQGSAWNFVMSTITGNVGIGLPSPVQKLHVNGSGLFNGIVMGSKGASGATANANSVGIFENNTNGYLNILTPNANESGVLFGNPASAMHGGLVYNAPSTPNGLQLRTNLNTTRMVINSEGYVGIGTTNPEFMFHVRKGNSGLPSYPIYNVANFENNDHCYINIQAPSNKVTGVNFENQENDGSIWFTDRFTFFINSLAKMVIEPNGNVGIGVLGPAERLQVNGNGRFYGTVEASCGILSCSDIRYKNNILPLTNTLSSIRLLDGIYYNWDKEKFPDKNFSDKRQIGIIAQELEQLFPELVNTDKQGFKTVDYSRLSPILLEAIKEQQSQIDMLTREIEQLKEMFAAMKK